MRLLIISLGLYLFPLLVTLFLRYAFKKYKGKGFPIPYDRLPIGIALALLATAAGVLASGNETMANDLAIMAYYLLTLGVLLQIITYIREQRAKGRAQKPGDRDSGNRVKDEDHSAEDE